MKKAFIILLMTTVVLHAFSESVYTYDLKKDIVIGSVSLGLSISSLFINYAENNASVNDIPQKNSVNSFDRSLMFEFNRGIDIASDVALYGLLALPIVSLSNNFNNSDVWLTYGVMYAESILLVFGTTEIMKRTLLRYRPYTYFGEIPSGESKEYYKSFPSRHTAFAFMSAGFLTSTFFAEYPDSRLKIPVSTVAYTLAAGVGAGRIFSGNHFIGDVLIGAAIGSLYGYLIPHLHLRKTHDTVTLSVFPSGFLISIRY